MKTFLEEAEASSRILATLSGADKNRVLKEMAIAPPFNTRDILKAHAQVK